MPVARADGFGRERGGRGASRPAADGRGFGRGGGDRPEGRAGRAGVLRPKIIWPRTRRFGAKLWWALAARSCRCTSLGALAFAGRVLPDATLRGGRRCRSHGGTVPAVASRNLLSEVFSPGSETSCRKRRAGRGADMPAMRTVASAPLPRGRRRLLAGRWPRVTGLTSCLSGCVRLQRVDAVCRAAPSRRLADFARSARSARPLRPCASRPEWAGPFGGVGPPDSATAFWSAQ